VFQIQPTFHILDGQLLRAAGISACYMASDLWPSSFYSVGGAPDETASLLLCRHRADVDNRGC